METNINNKTLHIPAARGRVSVPNRHGLVATQNIALDSVAVKPVIKVPAVASKPQAPRVTFDSMTAKPVQMTAPIQPVQTIQPIQPAEQAPMVNQAPLQTAVVMASNQPTTNIVPMNVAVNNNSVAAVPMIQVAPMQEVALKQEKKNNTVTQSFKDNTVKAKEGFKKFDVKKIGSSAVSKLKGSGPSSVSTVDILRYGIVAVILIITGYLAYDTWTTNQRAKDIFSQSAAAANVSGVAEGTNTGEAEPVYTVGPDMPKYLSIPKLGMSNVKIEQVGLTGNNKVDVPKGIDNVAWYDGSNKPGEKGAMFINGHINDVGAGGAFDKLKSISAGDKIIVERGDGTKFNYEVIEAVTLPTTSIDMGEVLRAHGGDEGINLMTCAGTYNFNTMSYSHRVIVYGKRI